VFCTVLCPSVLVKCELAVKEGGGIDEMYLA
jgi:hypothetical protein